MENGSNKKQHPYSLSKDFWLFALKSLCSLLYDAIFHLFIFSFAKEAVILIWNFVRVCQAIFMILVCSLWKECSMIYLTIFLSILKLLFLVLCFISMCEKTKDSMGDHFYLKYSFIKAVTCSIPGIVSPQ